jgi:hypothetical protein
VEAGPTRRRCRGGRDLVPLGVLGREVRVELAEHLGLEGGLHGVADLLQRGPDVARGTPGAVLAGAERFGGQVDVDRPARAKATTSGRGHEEVGLDVLVHARLEVAVAGETEAVTRSFLTTASSMVGLERAGVADAGGAAVADGVEAELVEVGLQAGLLR